MIVKTNMALWVQDCSAATENILLAAHGLGLGAVWTALYLRNERAKSAIEGLKLPDHIVPLCAIIIGHPAENPEPKDKWLPENVSYNEFGGKAEYRNKRLWKVSSQGRQHGSC